MKHTELTKGHISSLLSQYSFLDKIKVRKPSSLFDVEPLWKNICSDLCPFCGKALKFGRTRPIVMCGRKRCIADPKFLLTRKKYEEVKAKVISYQK